MSFTSAIEPGILSKCAGPFVTTDQLGHDVAPCTIRLVDFKTVVKDSQCTRSGLLILNRRKTGRKAKMKRKENVMKPAKCSSSALCMRPGLALRYVLKLERLCVCDLPKRWSRLQPKLSRHPWPLRTLRICQWNSPARGQGFLPATNPVSQSRELAKRGN